MLRAHILTAANGSLNLDLPLTARLLNLSVLALDVLHLHRLHLDRHRCPILTPQVEGL